MDPTASEIPIELGRRYRAGLAEKLSELALAWERWLAAPDDLAAKQSFQVLVHRLAGSAPAYGFTDVGRCAQRLDERLVGWDGDVRALRPPLNVLCHELAAPAEALMRTLGRAAREPVPVANAGGAGPAAGRPLYVLLVDDETEQAAIWREALSAHGLRVRAVATRAALEAELVVECPDVLLIDYWLESETAVDLVRWLRNMPEFVDVPRVCLTADEGPLPRQTAMDAGFSAVLRKTVDPQDLADVLRQLVMTARRR